MDLLLETAGKVSDMFGLFGGVFATLAWLKLRAMDRLNEKVSIFLSLTDGDETIELPLEMRRRDLTRAEILGRIGMIPTKEDGKRFSLRWLSTPEFITAINTVMDREISELVIPCTSEELDQFDL